MFKHEKQLFHPVAVERPNPQYAALLQEQLGGGNGELKAAMQYLSQSFRIKDQKIKDLFLDIAAEELGHMEMVAQTINLLNGHDVDADQVKAGEIQSHVILGLNPGLINASGYSWTGDYVTVTAICVRTCSATSLLSSGPRWSMNTCTARSTTRRSVKPSTSCSTGRRLTTRCSGMPSTRCRTVAPTGILVRPRRRKCISPSPIPAPIPLLETRSPHLSSIDRIRETTLPNLNKFVGLIRLGRAVLCAKSLQHKLF